MDHQAQIDAKLAAIAARYNLTAIAPSDLRDALRAVYIEGRMDGALATAQLVAKTAAVAQPQAQDDYRSKRLERFASELPIGRSRHPDIDFDKPFMMAGGTMYTIVGYNTRAPQNPFLIRGPQGGIYKCAVDPVRRGQRR